MYLTQAGLKFSKLKCFFQGEDRTKTHIGQSWEMCYHASDNQTSEAENIERDARLD